MVDGRYFGVAYGFCRILGEFSITFTCNVIKESRDYDGVHTNSAFHRNFQPAAQVTLRFVFCQEFMSLLHSGMPKD